MYIDDLDLVIEYECGCQEGVRIGVNLPKNFCEAERTTENDEKLIDYLTKNYRFDGFSCRKKHGNAPRGFYKIVEVM